MKRPCTSRNQGARPSSRARQRKLSIATARATLQFSTNSTEVIVQIPGDISGDLAGDICDAVLLAGAFSSSPSSSNWNFKSDLNNDGYIDIYDAISLANHYNERYP